MKDQGLVAVHIGPGNPDRNISGPVAVLMKNEEYFLGAFIGPDDQLVLEMMPNRLINANTAWMRNYPYSQQLLKRLEELEGGSVKLATEVFTKMGEKKVEPPTDAEKQAVKDEVRVYGNGGNPTGYPYYGRQTTFAGSGYGKSVLEEIKTLAKVTKDKVEQVGGTTE